MPAVRDQTGYVFFHDEDEHPSQQTLQQIEQVADGTHRMSHHEDVAVEDHLPLHSALRREERRGMYWELESEDGCSGQATGRSARGSALN